MGGRVMTSLLWTYATLMRNTIGLLEKSLIVTSLWILLGADDGVSLMRMRGIVLPKMCCEGEESIYARGINGTTVEVG